MWLVQEPKTLDDDLQSQDETWEAALCPCFAFGEAGTEHLYWGC